MEPETFDAWLATQKIDRKASSCLTSRAESNFAAERDKRRECDQLVSFTPEWNRCHDDADNLHNGGVIANDIARAVDAKGRFDQSQGGQYLILTKSVFTAADWTAFVGQIRSVLPRVTCS